MTHAAAHPLSEEMLERMPQTGEMRLIARVLRLDEETIHCVARDHRGADYPLRVEGALEPLSLIELGAQAAAAHASVHGMGQSHAGLLLALRDVEVLGAPGDAPLAVAARREWFDAGAARYAFEIGEADAPVLRGVASMQMRPAS